MQRQAPDPEWLLYEAIAPKGLTIVAGRPKAGKSFVAYLMAMALASGRKLGPFVPPRRVKCGYLDLEGVPKKTAERFALLCIGHDIPEKLLANLRMVDGISFQLLEPGVVEEVIAFVKTYRLEVLFIDTYAASFSGDENSKQDAQKYIDALKVIRLETGCAIVLVHHTNKAQFAYRETQVAMDADGGLRGSSAIAGAYDVIFSLQEGWVGDRYHDAMLTRGKYTGEAWTPYELIGEKDEDGAWTQSQVTFGKKHEGLGFWTKPPEGRAARKKKEDE